MSTVRIERGGTARRIDVRFAYDPGDVRRIKTIPGARWRKSDKAWAVPLTIKTCHDLRATFGDRLHIGPELAAWARANINLEQRMWELSQAEDAELVNVDKPTAEWLRPYQRSGVRFISESPAPLVADQMGLGKTAQVLIALKEGEAIAGQHLIIAPKTAVETGVWQREIERLVGGAVYAAIGDRAKREAIIAEFFDDPAETKWLVVNPAMLRFAQEKVLDEDGDVVHNAQGKPEVELVPMYPELHIVWTTAIIDECHKDGTRNPKTLTAQGLAALQVTGKRIAMSGTPMTNKPIDLWGTLHWLDPDVFSSKWAWAEQWLTITDNGWGKEIGGIRPEVTEDFFRSLAPYMLRRTKEEVATDLPPKNRIDIWADMTPKQKKVYMTFAKEAQVRLAETDVSATNVLSELTRLKQFAGALQDAEEVWDNAADGWKLKLVSDFAESGKREHLEELMAELGVVSFDGRGKMVAEPVSADSEKLVIFSQFTSLVDDVVAWLQSHNVGVCSITGNTTGKVRKRAVDSFQNGTDEAVMVMNTHAGGTAITLDRASTVVFLDETWSPTDQEQAEDRCHRISRNHVVNVYTIRSKGTIEETIMERVQGKADVHKFIMDERRSLELW